MDRSYSNFKLKKTWELDVHWVIFMDDIADHLYNKVYSPPGYKMEGRVVATVAIFTVDDANILIYLK